MANKPLIYSNRTPIQHFVSASKDPINWDKNFCVHFTTPSMVETFDDYDPIIIVGGTLTNYEHSYGQPQSILEATRIEREIFNSLEKGKIVCLIFGIDQLFSRVFERVGINFNIWGSPKVALKILQSEFTTLIKRFGSTKYDWFGDVGKKIAEAEDGKTVAFAKKVKNGTLLYLPCYMSLDHFSDINRVKDFIPCLIKALESFRPKVKYEPPTWVDTFRFTKEEPIVEKIIGLNKQLTEEKKKADIYSKFKEVLWFRDDELIDPVIRIFGALKLETNRDEQYKEDFWVIEDKTERIIVEVKALTSNLKRHHISQLDLHRGASDKPDDFPALLVVNSFNNSNSLEEKDKEISPAEIKKAIQLNVLIMRTLDLCNAFSLIEKGTLTSTKLLDLLKKECGWLKITSDGYEVRKN